MSDGLILHGYWRSSAAYRVRIALNFKKIAYRQVTHDLRTDAHNDAGYRAIVPHGLVPSLDTGEAVLIQSPAILEWIEESHPSPPLLPDDILGRAIVRSMAASITSDIHPLNNLRVLRRLRSAMAAGEDDVTAWIMHWISDGFSSLDRLVAMYGDGFAYGATPTIADCCLVPQVYSAERFGVEMASYPALRNAAKAASALPAFVAAHPANQPDADPS